MLAVLADARVHAREEVLGNLALDWGVLLAVYWVVAACSFGLQVMQSQHIVQAFFALLPLKLLAAHSTLVFVGHRIHR